MFDPLVNDSHDRRDSVLQFVQHPASMREVLQHRLESHDGRDFLITECRAGPVRRGEDFRFAVQYDLRLHDPVTGEIRDQMVTGMSYRGRRTRSVWESLSAARQNTADPKSRSLFAPFAYVPELDMLVQVFPHDHRLPALAAVMSGPPAELEPSLLALFGPSGWTLEGWDAQSVRYRVDTRATVRVTLRGRHVASDRLDTRSFYAKTYRDDGEARYAYDTLLDLQDRADANAARFTVPAPIAVSAALRTLIQAEVSGTPLIQIVRRERDAIPSVRLAARATADLHGLDLDLQRLAGDSPPRSLQNRIARLHRASETLNSVRPDLTNDVAHVVSTVVNGLTDGPRAPAHGDLKPDHFLIDGGSVSLIDFDFLRGSDPILDVANMESHLARAETRASSPRDPAETASQVFVEEYFAHAPADGMARLRLYRAMSAISDAARLQPGTEPRRRDRIDDLVQQAQRSLASEGH